MALAPGWPFPCSFVAVLSGCLDDLDDYDPAPSPASRHYTLLASRAVFELQVDELDAPRSTQAPPKPRSTQRVCCAVGSAVACGIWTSEMPVKLAEHLQNVNQTTRNALFGSIMAFPFGDPVRDGVIAAYGDVMKLMIVAVAATVPSVVSLVLCWSLSWSLGDKQNAGDAMDLKVSLRTRSPRESECGRRKVAPRKYNFEEDHMRCRTWIFTLSLNSAPFPHPIHTRKPPSNCKPAANNAKTRPAQATPTRRSIGRPRSRATEGKTNGHEHHKYVGQGRQDAKRRPKAGSREERDTASTRNAQRRTGGAHEGGRWTVREGFRWIWKDGGIARTAGEETATHSRDMAGPRHAGGGAERGQPKWTRPAEMSGGAVRTASNVDRARRRPPANKTTSMPAASAEFAVRTPNGVWSATRQDMEAGERCVEGTVGSGEDHKQLIAGTFIWAIPEDKYPRDVREDDPDAMELREIQEIAWHPLHNKFIYKCRVYLHGHNITEAGPFNFQGKATAKLLSSVGGKQEYVKTMKTIAYVWETRIEDVVDVAKLSTASATFKTLYPGQPYTRTDLEVRQRQWGTVFMWYAAKAPDVVCKANCRLRGVYAPHRDEMRWCKSCRRWFHTECMEADSMGWEHFNDDDLGIQPSDNVYAWWYAEEARIARVPRSNEDHEGVPYTIETTLQELRRAKHTYDADPSKELPDFPKYLKQVIEQDRHHVGDKVQMFEEVMETVGNTPGELWYECGGDECDEVI
ncbi:hypothetical protein LXA43DRAFT_1063523 [Ganoderma leucocontextum]|nr:hypothetical protein LXA43DRAFT_1063523 [Ganoderma leucocontextum]